VALNPPTSPTATPTTPIYGDDETTWVDDGAQPGQTQNLPQAPPFSPHYLPPHRLEHASPLTLHATPPPPLPPPIRKRATPHNQPPASAQPNTSPQTAPPAPQNEAPPNKRQCLYATRECLRETYRPSAATLRSPTSPMARPATPTFDDYTPSPAHDDVRLAPALTAPAPQPFKPFDTHPHPSHLASPETPHPAPPSLLDPPALNCTRLDSLPPASC
jgi:hypothetical protein